MAITKRKLWHSDVCGRGMPRLMPRLTRRMHGGRDLVNEGNESLISAFLIRPQRGDLHHIWPADAVFTPSKQPYVPSEWEYRLHVGPMTYSSPPPTAQLLCL